VLSFVKAFDRFIGICCESFPLPFIIIHLIDSKPLLDSFNRRLVVDRWLPVVAIVQQAASHCLMGCTAAGSALELTVAGSMERFVASAASVAAGCSLAEPVTGCC